MARFGLAMLCLLTLTACASKPTASGVVTVEAVCTVWPLTTYSKKDTPETQRGNSINNERRVGFGC